MSPPAPAVQVFLLTTRILSSSDGQTLGTQAEGEDLPPRKEEERHLINSADHDDH